MTNQIYEIWQAMDADMYEDIARPDGIAYRSRQGLPKTARDANIMAGTPGHSVEQWTPPDLVVSHSGKTSIDQWDYFGGFGFGVFSSKAIDAFAASFSGHFVPLPVHLEGFPYWGLHCRRRIDCLDKAASNIEYFLNSSEVMMAHKYKFHKSLLLDRAVFAIPEASFRLYATAGVPQMVESAGLRGFQFTLVDGA